MMQRITRAPVLALLALLVLASIAAPSRACAQTRAERNQARQAFRDGERAFEENDNEAALTLFRRAFELAPNDVVRFNIAVCLERLGRHREAMLEYESAAASEQLPAAERARATESAERARGRLGTLVVNGDFGGTDVQVDGEVLCQIPCELVLDAGVHMVHVEAAGLTFDRTAEVERGGTATVVLEAPQPEPEPEPEPVIAEVAPAERPTRGPGFLTWTGIGVAALGAAGIITFGVLAQSRHDEYVVSPTVGVRDEGILYRDLSNASIAVASVGAILVLVDLIFLAPQTVEPEERAVSLGFGDVRVRF